MDPLILFFLAATEQPWWMTAILGSLGALVLSVLANIVQYNDAKALREDIVAERDKFDKVSEKAVAALTEVSIHVAGNSKTVDDFGSVVVSEHKTTRADVIGAIKEIKAVSRNG